MYFFPQVFTWQARTLALVSGCDPSFISQVLPFLSGFLWFSESLGISLQCVFRFRNQIRRKGKRRICHDYRTDHTRPEVGGGCSEAEGCHQRPEIRGEAQRAKELSELCTYTPMHCLNIHIT